MSIKDRLFELRDEEYAQFQAKLTPNVDKDLLIGVRVPVLRAYAKEIKDSPESKKFLSKLPHKYYDENMLHGLLLSEMKDYDECIEYVDKFLPFVDNWAVCDIMSPKVFKKYKEKLLIKIREWIKSDDTYTCRFGIEMLMSHFLDQDFKEEYLQWVSCVKSDEYYAKMMIAWFFATALTKQWDASVKVIESKELSPWVHNKSIQKARESYRITNEQKIYLNSLKIEK